MIDLEFKTINAVLKEKDLLTLMTPNGSDIFVSCRDIWDSIKSYYTKYNSMPTLETIQERFPDLPAVATSGEAKYYLDLLREEYIKVKVNSVLLKYAREMKDDSGPRVLNRMQAELSDLSRITNTSRELDITDFDDAERYYEEVRRRAAAMGGVPGIPTGIDFIDSSMVTGLQGGDLIVVFGWASKGKSLFTTLLGCNAFNRGFKPMIVSLEMAPERVRDRAYTILGSGLFTHSQLSLGDINLDDFRAWSNKQSQRREFIVMAGDGTNDVTPNMISAKYDQHRPDLMIIDYAQLCYDNGLSNDMTGRMKNLSQQTKKLAVATGIPIILISSATPDSATAADSPPLLEQVAWSKQIAYDADAAWAVHKHADSNLIEVVSRKVREGPLFSGFINWDINRGVINEEFDL